VAALRAGHDVVEVLPGVGHLRSLVLVLAPLADEPLRVREVNRDDAHPVGVVVETDLDLKRPVPQHLSEQHLPLVFDVFVLLVDDDLRHRVLAHLVDDCVDEWVDEVVVPAPPHQRLHRRRQVRVADVEERRRVPHSASVHAVSGTATVSREPRGPQGPETDVVEAQVVLSGGGSAGGACFFLRFRATSTPLPTSPPAFLPI
jgi:hypothetical protein